MAHAIAIDLDDLPLDPEPTVKVATYEGRTAGVLAFGWFSRVKLESSDPERVETVAGLLMDLARDLRIAQVNEADRRSLSHDIDDVAKAS